LSKAIATYTQGIHPDQAELLFDDTAYGGAAEGFIITRNKLYFHGLWNNPLTFNLAEIRDIHYNFISIDINGRNIDIAMLEKSDRPILTQALKELAGLNIALASAPIATLYPNTIEQFDPVYQRNNINELPQCCSEPNGVYRINLAKPPLEPQNRKMLTGPEFPAHEIASNDSFQ
jgi:hypothetical protein